MAALCRQLLINSLLAHDMNFTIRTVRTAGCLAGVWLLVSSVIGARQIFSFYSGNLSSVQLVSPSGMAFHYFGPAILLGVMLLLPWSRIRAMAIWLPSFLILLATGGAYLWRLFLPFIGVWRPSVLLQQGILQILFVSVVFVFIQFTAIVTLRFRANSSETAMA